MSRGDMNETSGPAPERSECTEVIRSMYLFIDGEMPSGERVHVQAHLDECIQCFEAFDFEAELKSMVGQKCKEKAPMGLQDKILDKLRQASQGDCPPPV